MPDPSQLARRPTEAHDSLPPNCEPSWITGNEPSTLSRSVAGPNDRSPSRHRTALATTPPIFYNELLAPNPCPAVAAAPRPRQAGRAWSRRAWPPRQVPRNCHLPPSQPARRADESGPGGGRVGQIVWRRKPKGLRRRHRARRHGVAGRPWCLCWCPEPPDRGDHLGEARDDHSSRNDQWSGARRRRLVRRRPRLAEVPTTPTAPQLEAQGSLPSIGATRATGKRLIETTTASPASDPNAGGQPPGEQSPPGAGGTHTAADPTAVSTSCRAGRWTWTTSTD